MSKKLARVIFMAQAKTVNPFDEDDDECSGCLFEKAHSSACHEAEAKAKRWGIPTCEEGNIFVPATYDVRQPDLFETPEAAPESSGNNKEK